MFGARTATCCILAITCAVGSAHAQGQSSALAEALFQQGRDLMAAGKTADACPKFAESHRLEPKLGTLLNLAVCHEKEGKWASAWASFTSAKNIAERENQPDRARLAEERIEALEGKLARLAILVPPDAPSGLVVKLDGATFNTFGTPLPLDPGSHVIQATAPMKKPWQREIEVPPEQASLEVVVPVLEDAPQEPVPPPPVAPPVPVLAPEPKPAPDGPGSSTEGTDYTWLVVTGFSVGGAGLLVGTIAGASAASQASDIKDTCDGDACPSSQEEPISDATTMANVSNVGFVIGALGLGAGLIGLVLNADDAPDAAVTPTTELVVLPSGLALRGTF